MREPNGKRTFLAKEWLTPTQISGVFSNLLLKQKKGVILNTTDTGEEEQDEDEVELPELDEDDYAELDQIMRHLAMDVLDE